MTVMIRESDGREFEADLTLAQGGDLSPRRWTEHPVQGSASRPAGTVNDHVQTLPATIILQVQQSETPTTGDTTGVQHVADLVDFLTEEPGALYTLVLDGLPTMTGMGLEGVPVDRGIVQAADFRLPFRRVVVVESVSVEMPARAKKPSTRAEPAAEGETDTGRQSAKSLLQTGVDLLSSTFGGGG